VGGRLDFDENFRVLMYMKLVWRMVGRPRITSLSCRHPTLRFGFRRFPVREPLQLPSSFKYGAPIFSRPLLDTHEEMCMPMRPIGALVESPWA